MNTIPMKEHDAAMEFARQRIAELHDQLEAQRRMYENKIRSMLIMQQLTIKQGEFK